MQRMEGMVAVVTGASRGAGRGIALALGEAGATVYVTGRSSREGATTDSRPETIEETAEAVTARGGRGIPVRCDHTQEDQVAGLFARVQEEQGRLDLLVNAVWGGSENAHQDRGRQFWLRSPSSWDGMFTAGVNPYIIACRLAAPLMLAQGHGLMTNITFWHGGFLTNLYYDVAMNAINRMSACMAHELRETGVTVVALSPGFIRTERVMDAGLPAEALQGTESTEYPGRAVVALATDPAVKAKSGQVLTAGDLARAYGFTDIDGRYVPPYIPS